MHTMLYHIGREEFIIDNLLDDIAENLLEYQKNYFWYELCDNYGNVNTEEAYDLALEDIYNSLQNSPQDIIKHLQENIEDAECEVNFEKDEYWKDTKDLLQQVNSYIEKQAEEDLEID